MEQGRVACVFEELSVDSPRNRFIAATLLSAAPARHFGIDIEGEGLPHHHVWSDELRHQCASTAFKMQSKWESANGLPADLNCPLIGSATTMRQIAACSTRRNSCTTWVFLPTNQANAS